MQALNWIGYKFNKFDGYGRYSISEIRALTQLGLDVTPVIQASLDGTPAWMHSMMGLDFSKLTIQCLPAMESRAIPGRSYILSMTEDTSCPDDWPQLINERASRLIVPCAHNAEVFERRGVRCPIDIIAGGTDPAEFPILQAPRRERPYTFLCLGDRPPRKGTEQVWSAFYKLWPETSQRDVRLVIKGRPAFLNWFNSFNFSDPRISFWKSEVESPADIYAQADCFVFPSYGEGWGMPPREAAMMGLPVIATQWSGLDDGHLDEWAIPLEKFRLGPSLLGYPDGEWAVCDVDEVAEKMLWCFEHQDEARAKGLAAANWLRENQTWQHSAQQLIDLMERYA